MGAVVSRYEIVRTEAEQPWFAREVASNGRETWKTSENYTRPRGPSEAIVRHKGRVCIECRALL